MRKVSFNNTNNEQRSGRQTVYQRGGQRESSPHYVLLYSNEENSGDEESVPLRTVSQSQSLPRRVEVIKVQLQPEDTLQALSLRYGSTVSELKRINNIHKDNEIFAHRTIKVPVKPFSLLTERLNQPNSDSDPKVQVGDLVAIEDPPGTSREEQIINLITTPIVQHPSKPEFKSVLNSLGDSSTIQHGDSPEALEEGENDQLLSSEGSESEQRVTNSFRCSSTDWDFSWPQLVCCSSFLGFTGLLIYILYLAEYFSKHHATVGH